MGIFFCKFWKEVMGSISVIYVIYLVWLIGGCFKIMIYKRWYYFRLLIVWLIIYFVLIVVEFDC